MTDLTAAERARQHHFMVGPPGYAKKWPTGIPKPPKPLRSAIQGPAWQAPVDPEGIWDKLLDAMRASAALRIIEQARLEERTFRQPKEKFVPINRKARRRRR